MLSTLNVRATNKNTCEDSVFVKETESFVYGAIADGCSTGIKTHFASQLLCYIVEGGGINVTSEASLLYFKTKLKEVKKFLSLDDIHLVSTLILFKYNKEERKLEIRPCGDTVYYINGLQFIVDYNNIPDYISYHLEEDFIDFVKRYPVNIYHEVDFFQICSDGIQSFQQSQFTEHKYSPDILLDDPISENFVQRMFNILKKDNWIINDDLSIVSYATK